MAEPKFADPYKSWARAMDEAAGLMMGVMSAPIKLMAQSFAGVSKLLSENSNSDARHATRPRTVAASHGRTKAKVRRQRRRSRAR